MVFLQLYSREWVKIFVPSERKEGKNGTRNHAAATATVS